MSAISAVSPQMGSISPSRVRISGFAGVVEEERVMAISKGKRFEIFKRDGFTCQYCGRRPPDVVLEVDHIDPRCSGGTDQEINLITSCWDCNRGKGGKSLGQVRPRPDADLEYLKTQQELAEATRYIETSKTLSAARSRITEHLESVWCEVVTDRYSPTPKQWKTWLAYHDPERIERAIRLLGGRFHSGQFGSGKRAVDQAIRYVSGIMNNLARENGSIQ